MRVRVPPSAPGRTVWIRRGRDKQKSNEEAQRQFDVNAKMLRNCVDAYDKGDKFEVSRIVQCIFSYPIDANRKSPALLNRLSRKYPVMLDSAGDINPADLMPSL